MDLLKIVKDQREELRVYERQKYVVREAEKISRSFLTSKLIKVVMGPRRAGKSTLAYHLIRNKKFAYLNFDDERLFPFTPDEALSALHRAYGDFDIIFLDEVQNLPKWELLLSRLKRMGHGVIVTGSNSNLLATELTTRLTGRYVSLELFPFSFREYLKSKAFSEDYETTRGEGLLRRELDRYVSLGAFPEVIVGREDQKLYARELFKAVIQRDIIGRYRIKYRKTFYELAFTLAGMPGGYVALKKIKDQLSVGSVHTIKNYLHYLSEAYLFFFVSEFSWKIKEREKSAKKVYPLDTTFPLYVAPGFSENKGRLYETLVALELRRQKASHPNMDFFYFRSPLGHEVDFVLRKGKRISQLIQVTLSPDREREIRSLKIASKKTGCKNALIICEDEGTIRKKGLKIKLIPIWKWLLSPI